MKAKRIIGWGLLALSGLLCSLPARADKRGPLISFMRQKLGYSQSVIEGITLERYNVVITNSMKLFKMSQATAWRTVNHPEYLQKTEKFQAEVIKLIDAAKAKDTPEMLAAYGRVTASCVDCHHMTRRDQFAPIPPAVSDKK